MRLASQAQVGRRVQAAQEAGPYAHGPRISSAELAGGERDVCRGAVAGAPGDEDHPLLALRLPEAAE
ncbi:hypothetical protein [Deinococcus petrolearius]|uniref:Uncharacterized protein n=1 Tax=Deinococcus petrolearius TaxID=1751295 RepID=A0ABW1DDX7_9DEIO